MIVAAFTNVAVRICAFPGCEATVPNARAKFCSDAHRVADWKRRREDPRDRKRRLDRLNKQRARERARREGSIVASDAKISLNKAVDNLAAKLQERGLAGDENRARELAVEFLADAAPKRTADKLRKDSAAPVAQHDDSVPEDDVAHSQSTPGDSRA